MAEGGYEIDDYGDAYYDNNASFTVCAIRRPTSPDASVAMHETFDDFCVRQLPEEEDNGGNIYAETSTITSPSNHKKTCTGKKLMAVLLASFALIAIVVGTVGLGMNRNREQPATSSSLKQATLEDCLAEMEGDEDEKRPTYAPNFVITQLGGEGTKEEPARDNGDHSMDDGSSRRDLRGMSNGDRAGLSSVKHRILECEELLASKDIDSPKGSLKESSDGTSDGSENENGGQPVTIESSPTDNPTSKPTPTPISTNSPTKMPSASSETVFPGSPTQSPVSSSPTKDPTDSPIENPLDMRTTASPTIKPTNSPTIDPVSPSPTTSPINSPETPEDTQDLVIPPINIPSDYYKYTPSDTECSGAKVQSEMNVDGPAPFPNKTNVALQFFAFGSTPYDSDTNTCIGEDGNKEDECTRFTCTVPAGALPPNNTCTFEGPHYDCVKDILIPYMNDNIDAGDAAFMVHTGDFIRGSGLGTNTRCTNYTFASRKNLFSAGLNFLNIPGDNDWNECFGYDINSNTDPQREMWREYFSTETSPFSQFGTDFPSGGVRPDIYRMDGNPEIFFFNHSNVAIFGLNRPERDSYISNQEPADANEMWVGDRLLNDSSCTFKSIVLISHSWLKESLYIKIDEYFGLCGHILPILSVSGNTQPRSYCMSEELGTRINVTVEAFKSAPLLISVVRDQGGGGDYFHVEDVDLSDQNNECPNL